MASRTRLQLVQAVADSLGLRVSGTLTASTTVLLTAANYPYIDNRTDANASDYVGDEFYTTSGTAPTPGAAVVIATYSPSAGTFVPSVTYVTKPDATSTFDIYLSGVRKTDLDDALNRALRNRRYRAVYPLTIVTDGDMTTSGVTNWTNTSNTRVKDTTAGGVWRGLQSLSTTASAALGQVQSAAIKVSPSQRTGYYCRALVRADIGTARLTAYDVTNAAVLKTADWADEGWGFIDFNADAISTTRDLAMRLINVANNDVAFWNYVQVLPIGATEIALPSWVIRAGQVRRVFSGRPGATLPDDDDFNEYRWHRVVEDFGNANNQYRLQLSPPITGPVFFEGSRGFDEVTADSTAVTADREWIELATSVELLKKMVSGNYADSRRWAYELSVRQPLLNAMDRVLLPPPIIDDQWDEPF